MLNSRGQSLGGRYEEVTELLRPKLGRHDDGHDPDQSQAVSPIVIRPHDPRTGEEIDKAEVVKGYEYGRGQFVTFTPEELKALDIESSKIIDLEKFTPRDDIDSVYFDTSYYLYPDGPIAVETLRVIAAAMAEAGVVGLGRLTLSRRERTIIVEPRGTGMALFILRAADEVRAAQFDPAEGELDTEMVTIAKAIIAQRTGRFDPTTYRDRYQDALRELIEAKLKGLPIKPKPVSAPAPVIDLMAALKRSLAQGTPAERSSPRTASKRKTSTANRRQSALLLPLSGGRDLEPTTIKPASSAPRRRRKA